MSDNTSPTPFYIGHNRYKDFYPIENCQALDCVRKAVYRLSIKAGKYGLVLILVCQECVGLFTLNNEGECIDKI
ncbi:MAG: hypothetical protein AB7V56_14745 [Candidatus Nitrosocosmicus sp.]